MRKKKIKESGRKNIQETILPAEWFQWKRKGKESKAKGKTKEKNLLVMYIIALVIIKRKKRRKRRASKSKLLVQSPRIYGFSLRGEKYEKGQRQDGDR